MTDYTYLAEASAVHRIGRRFWHFVLVLLIRILTRVDERGIEQLPEEGPVLLYFNHIHYLDPFIIIGLLRGKRYTVPMAKRELATGPLIGRMIGAFGAIFIERGGADVGALRAALAVLEHGQVLLLAPEGTRNKVDHSLQPAQKGLGMMVRRTDPVLMPVAIWGTPDFPGAFKKLHRPCIHVHFGEPYRVDVPKDIPRREADAAISDLSMQELAALLPGKMHGVYSPPDSPHPWKAPVQP